MTSEETIKQFYLDLDALGLKFPVAEISAATGFSKGQVSGYLNNREKGPSRNFIKKFYEVFPESSKNVPRATSDNSPKYDRFTLKNGHSEKRIPFYDAEATAGIVETDMTPLHAPAGTIDVGDLLSDSQAAIRIYGNSMNPNYPPGCVVGLARVTSSFIEPGEVYVIETIDKRILKRLYYKDDDPESEFITCYSDNTMKFEGGTRHGKLAYPHFNLPKSEIKNIFMVTGVIKRNMNSVIINRK